MECGPSGALGSVGRHLVVGGGDVRHAGLAVGIDRLSDGSKMESAPGRAEAGAGGVRCPVNLALQKRISWWTGRGSLHGNSEVNAIDWP